MSYDTIYKTETDSQRNYGCQGGRMRTGQLQGKGVWNGHVHTAVFKTDNQQRPPAEHRDLFSVSCGSLGGRGIGEEWIHVYVWLNSFAVHLKLSQHC